MKEKETGFLHDPCVYINLLQDNLRNRYGNGFPVIKELVQNADDAGARGLLVGWTAGLPDSHHPLLRGPALFAVNNGPFKPEDAHAIRMLGLNSKAGDKGSIGKFGLGLKSVFHLCEAFFFLSSTTDSSGTSSDFTNGILNPWSGPPKSPFSFHREWNQFTPEDQLRIQQHLNLGEETKTWFCLWVPLRRTEHREGCAPIVEEFPGDESEPPSWLTTQDVAFELARLLPLLRNLKKVFVWAPWRKEKEALFRVSLKQGSERRAYDGKNPLSEARFFEGSILVEVRGQQPKHARFVGHESWVGSLEKFRNHPGWPKSFAVNPQTQLPERKPEKADPHCAVTLMAWPEPTGGLRIARAVFLPLTRTEKLLSCPGPTRFDLLQHGYFFIDTGRGDLEIHSGAVDQAGFPQGESQLRGCWNAQLRDLGTLRLLLPVLDRFCEQANLAQSQITELTRALSEPSRNTADGLPAPSEEIWACGDRTQVCAEQQWVYCLYRAGARWKLLPPMQQLLEIPVPESGDQNLPFAALPRLAELAEAVPITFVDWPRLSLTDTGGDWPAEHLDCLLRGNCTHLLEEASLLMYVAQFLARCLPSIRQRGPNVDALARFARGLCRAARPKLEEEKGRALRRVLREVPSDRRRKLPVPESPLGEDTWALIGGLVDETVVYPEVFEPEDRPGTAQLATPEALAILEELASRRYREIKRQGADNLRERLTVAVFKASRENDKVFEGSGPLALFQDRAAGQKKGLLTVSELRAAADRGTLFADSPDSLAATLQRALSSERIVLLHEDTYRGIFEGRASEICNAAACIRLLIGAPALATAAEERSGLLTVLLQKAGTSAEARRAIRYLLHGQSERFDETGELLAPVAGEQSPLWEKVCHAALKALAGEWRIVPPDLVPMLSEHQRAFLGVEPFGHVLSLRLLREVPPPRRNAVELHLDRAEYKELLQAFESPAGREVALSLPIHPDAAGGSRAFDANTYWQGSFPLIGTSLAERLVILPIEQDDEVLAALQRQLAPERVLDADRVLGLVARDPQQLGVHWHLVLDALACVQQLPDAVVRKLRDAHWLPCDGTGPPVRPGNVIHLAGLEDEVARALDHGEAPFCDRRRLARAVKEHQGFSALVRWVFPPGGEALQMLGQVVCDRAEFTVGRRNDEPLPLDDFLSAFALLPTPLMPSAPLLEKVCKVRPRGEVLQYLVPELQRIPLGADRLEEILKALATQHAQTSGNRQAAWKMFRWYFRELAGHADFASRLPRLSLLSRSEDWRSPDRLSLGADGLSEADQLHPDLEESLPEILRRPPTVKGPEPASLKHNSGERQTVANSAQTLRRYFAPWEGVIPREVIGGFLAVLTGEPQMEQFAKDMLGERFNLQNIRKLLDPSPDNPFLTPNMMVFHLVSVEVVPLSDTVHQRNLVGGFFEASRAKKLDHLFLGYSKDMLFHRVENTNTCYFTWHVRLLAIRPSDWRSQQIAELLRNSTRCYLMGCLNRQPSSQGLAKVFQSLQEPEQRDLRVAQNLVLKRALGSALVELGLNTCQPFADLLARYRRAERRLAEEEEARERHRVDLGFPYGEEVEGLLRDLRRFLEEDEKVQATLREAVRGKIGGHYQYTASAVPFEIFQNADDAYVEAETLASQNQGNSACWFVVSRDTQAGAVHMTFAHGGRLVNQDVVGTRRVTDRGFDQDLEKMLLLHFSDKDSPGVSRPVTGKFGLGFKSVLLVCDTPRVLSGRLAFEILGGMFPRWWAGAEECLTPLTRATGFRSGAFTAVDLPLNSDHSPEVVLSDFRKLLPLLLGFARRIQQVTFWADGKADGVFGWSPQKVDAVAGMTVGRLPSGGPCEWSGSAVLKFDLGKGAVLLRLTEDRISFFPADVPTVWVTAPTQEQANVGFAVNGPFALDVGRAQLARTSTENELLAAEMGVVLGQRLIDLFRASDSDWPALCAALQFARGAEPTRFWESWWDLCGGQFLSRVEGADSVVRGLLRALLWGSDGQGAARLYAEQRALPTGLLTAPYRVLTRPEEIRFKVCGLLDDRSHLFEDVSAWESFRSKYPPGQTVSAERTWQVLQKLCPTLGSRSLEEIRLHEAIDAELRPGQAADPNTAIRLGTVVGKPILDQLGDSGEVKDLLNLLSSVQFLAEDNRYHPARELLLPAPHKDDQVDEALRAGFAPIGRVLSKVYQDVALDFFLACRRQMEAKLEEMAGWAVAAETEEKRQYVIEYLLRGERNNDLAVEIRKTGASGTWLGFLSPDWNDYPKEARYAGYLNSQQWAEKQETVRQRCRGICEKCRAQRMEEAHHKRIDRLGEEPLEDIEGLCKQCFETGHGHQGNGFAGGRPNDPGKNYREFLEKKIVNPKQQETLLDLLGLNRNRFHSLFEWISPPRLPDPAEVLTAIHDWWQKQRGTEVQRYQRMVYPDQASPALSLEDLDNPGNRKAWLTLFLLGMLHTMGRQRDQQHRSFLQHCAKQGWLDTFVDPRSTAQQWLDVVDGFFEEHAEEVVYYQWLKQFVGVRVLAKYLSHYAMIFREVGRLPGPFALTDLTRPRTSAQGQGWMPDAPPVSRVLGIGACFIVRELLRRKVVEDNPDAYPHCYVPVRSTRYLLEWLGCGGLSDNGPPWERSRVIYAFLQKHLGKNATFCGDFDLPLLLVGRDPELQREYLNAPLKSDESGEVELIFSL